MPVYEYRCTRCRKKSAVLVRASPNPVQPVCEHCGGASLVRLFSTFAVHRAADSAGDDFDDRAFAGVDESDPRAMAQALGKMGGDMREEMGPEFGEMIDQMEHGEMPEDEGGEPEMDGGDDLAA